ncbi:hypothetical protein M0R45_022893 [Rubus argutus]|uniref:Uncharacterized protein n=1 Tax=Rubus argutus TaxID=59490 RepID=A0AAW1WQI4_RUBAR
MEQQWAALLSFSMEVMFELRTGGQRWKRAVIWNGIDRGLVVVLMKKRKGGSRWAAGIPLGGEALFSSCQS